MITLLNITGNQTTYLIFGIVLAAALIFDLGLFSKKGEIISIKKALIQTSFWVFLALCFFGYLLVEYQGSANAKEKEIPIAFISAYLMEWSLSIDNIFVFILIFSSFGVKETQYGRILLIGILVAIILRIIFITLGVELVERIKEVLYFFGLFLLYTGIKMFGSDHDEEVHPKDNKTYKFLKRFLPITDQYDGNKLSTRINNKKYYTPLFVVILLVAITDIVFAIDSIPAVMGISTNKLVIYTSNIFAVLGLRSLFFLLRGAVSKFDYLPKGISIVLIFIGIKMLLPLLHYAGVPEKYYHLPIWISLLVIVICIGGSIWYSVLHKNEGTPEDVIEPPQAI